MDLALLKALVRAEAWKKQLLSGASPSVEAIAQMENVKESYARRVLRLAFLSPKLKRLILEGRAPAGLALRHLLARQLDLSWGAQEQMAMA